MTVATFGSNLLKAIIETVPIKHGYSFFFMTN